MSGHSVIQESAAEAAESGTRGAGVHRGTRVSLLTGGIDKPYVAGLSQALVLRGISLEVVGGDAIDSPEMHATPGLKFLNLRRSNADAGAAGKVWRILAYYAQLVRYAATASPGIFHILWNNKFELFDRTFLMLYYKLLGKKIVFTVHNVNAGKRDGNDSWLNRLTLRVQYSLCDHIFIHTEKMRKELTEGFGIPDTAVSVIPFGINQSVPDTDLTREDARRRLGIGESEKAILFFGALRPYKGLEYLVESFLELASRHPDYRLIIAGEPRKEAESYLSDVVRRIEGDAHEDQILRKLRYIPDEETEVYFKAADVLALPYTHVFQSGVLFLAYGFGLPVVATDVGSIRDEIIEGETGFLCQPRDAGSLAGAIERYFESDLFCSPGGRRAGIREWAAARHSWSEVSETTCSVYAKLSPGRAGERLTESAGDGAAIQ